MSPGARGLSSALLLLAGCASGLPAVTPVDVGRAKQRWPDTEAAELERGRALLPERCAGCHPTPVPTQLSAERWPGTISEMRAQQNVALTPEEDRALTRYVLTFTNR